MTGNNSQALGTLSGDFKLIPFNNFPKDKYNTLMPASIEELSPYHSVRYFQVEISPDPNDGDVYVESGALALRKRALDMLSDAAGIVWDTRNCRRIDDMKDDDLVVFQVVGGIRRPDGTIKAVTGTKEINLRDLAKNGMGEAQLKGIRLHKTRLAETKAYLAAMRSLMKIKGTYTAAELRKPFVVAQVYIDPTKDPDVARALRARVVQDVRELFGAGMDDHMQGQRQLPEPEQGEYEESGFPAAAIEAPEPEQPAPTPPAAANDPKLLARWDALWREATELGLKPEARPHRCSDADLTARGKALKAAIEDEKNRRHAAAQEGQGSF